MTQLSEISGRTGRGENDEYISSGRSNDGEKEEMSRSTNDLVIDCGFPVLNTFSRNRQLMEEDPVPRYPFASFPSALTIGADSNFLKDCALAFTARTKEESEAYSTGSTFFLPAAMTPRCALEALALDIFNAHTHGLSGTHFDVETSGAEWWTLLMDTSLEAHNNDISNDDEEEEDEVGMHFDADYGLETQLPNYLLHPRIATITYLTDVGLPTFILEKKSPPPNDSEKRSLGGPVNRAWLSSPEKGKHVAFDGRFLHGAPPTFFPEIILETGKTMDEDQQQRHGKSKRPKLSEESSDISSNFSIVRRGEKRITFLVNIWLNHCPIDAELMDDELCAQMTTLWEKEEFGDTAKGKGSNDYVPPYVWNLKNVESINNNLPMIQLDSANEKLKESAAGSQSFVVCNREITMHFQCTKTACHAASRAAATAMGKSVELSFGKDALRLSVGDEVATSDEEADSDDDDV